MSTTAEQFLLGGGGRSATFEHPGATTTGTIASVPQVRQQTDMDTGKPATWDNGDPKMQLVVQLQTTLRDDTNDDGLRNLYVKGSKDPASKSMHAAVAGAVRAAHATGLEVGGSLTVVYTGDGVAKTRGFNPPKQYSATYAPPAAGFLDVQGVGSVDTNTGEVQEAPPAASVATPANALASPTAEQVAAIKAAGLDPTKVFPGYNG